MYRLFYYGIDNNLGGLENYARSLLTHIVSSGVQIIIISCYENYAYREYFESFGIKSIIVPNYRKYPCKYYKSLLNILKNHNNGDIIQLNVMSYRNSLLFKAVKKSDINTLVVGHGSSLVDGLLSKLLHKINRYRFRKLGKKVSISNNVTNYMFGNNKDVAVIPNSVDIDRFRYKEEYRKEIRNKYGINNNYVIGHFGRISPAKNQEFSIKLINELAKVDSSYKLLLIGKNQNNEVMELIKNNKNIIYIDETTELYKYYSALDLFILPSRFEGFGLVLYEGLANGLDVVISDNVPYPEHISNNISQLQLDIDIWVKEILNHKKDRETKPVDGIEKYDTNFMIAQYFKLYVYF